MLVRQKMDADAGDVIAAMLQLSRPHETRLQEDRSAPLAEAAITAVVAKAASKGVWHVQPASVPGKGALGTLVLTVYSPGGRLQTCCAGLLQTRQRCEWRVSRLCARLTESTAQLVTCVGEAHGGASYCVNMKRIVDLIRMKEVRCCASLVYVAFGAHLRRCRWMRWCESGSVVLRVVSFACCS